jgi:hypothetical protein
LVLDLSRFDSSEKPTGSSVKSARHAKRQHSQAAKSRQNIYYQQRHRSQPEIPNYYASNHNLAAVSSIAATSTLSSIQQNQPGLYHPSWSLSTNYNYYVVNSTEYNNEYNHLNQFKQQQQQPPRVNRYVTPTKKSQSASSGVSSPNAIIANLAKNVNTCTATDLVLPSPIPHLPPISEKRSSIVTDSDYRTQSSSGTTATTADDDDTSQHSENETLSRKCGELAVDVECAAASQFESNNLPHLSACEALLSLEERFIDLMQQGVQQYSRPLRHCMMIQPVHHQLLFQNIEKLLAINEYQLNQLMSQDDSILIDMFATIGKLYENKTRMSGEAFDIYLSGIDKSIQFLNRLLSGETAGNIRKFLQDSQQDIAMDLETFLLLPLFYVDSIHGCLGRIRRQTSPHSDDHVCLTALLTNLEVFMGKSSLILSRFDIQNPLEARSQTGEEDEEANAVPDDVIYGEVANQPAIESKLDLVHSSFIEYKQVRANKWKRVRMLFFADRLILLSAHANVDRFLALLNNVSDSPSKFSYKTIMFSDVIKSKFNTTRSNSSSQSNSEFYVKFFKTASLASSSCGKSNIIRLKCASREEKSHWQRLFNRYLTQ